MNINKMRLFRLSSIDSNSDNKLWPTLKTYLIAASRYVGTYDGQSLHQPIAMSLSTALPLLLKNLDLAFSSASTPLSGLPILAFSRKTRNLTLLLPKNNEEFFVFDHAYLSPYIINIKNIDKYFLEYIYLYNKNHESNLNKSFKSYFPQSLIIFAALGLIIFMASSLFFSLMLLEAAQSSTNYLVLFFSAFSCFIFALLTHNFIKNKARQNFNLVSMWALRLFFSSIFYINLDRYYESSQTHIKSFLIKLNNNIYYYFNSYYKIIISSIIICVNIIIIFYVNFWLALIIIFLAACALWCAHALGAQKALFEQSIALLKDKLDQALAAFELSFAMALGLKAHQALIDRIELISRDLAQSERKSLNINTRLFFIFLVFLSALLLLINFFNLSIFLTSVIIINITTLSLALKELLYFKIRAKPLPLSFEILDEFARYKPGSSHYVAPVNIIGHIEMHDLTFSYNKSSLLIIKNASLTFEAHKFYLLLGPSGSGKSTLLKILMTQERAQEGHLAFDGQDAQSLEPELLRQYFGVVRQDSDTFKGSIRANILCGRDISARELDDLLYSHEIFDVILDMPMGLETYIFERAHNISRLQSVVILLARALIHRPKILFLDEIFKGLGTEHQELLARYIHSLSITRILVTHDKSFLKPDIIFDHTSWNAPISHTTPVI